MAFTNASPDIQPEANLNNTMRMQNGLGVAAAADMGSEPEREVEKGTFCLVSSKHCRAIALRSVSSPKKLLCCECWLTVD
jgi:hypothetical protein